MIHGNVNGYGAMSASVRVISVDPDRQVIDAHLVEVGLDPALAIADELAQGNHEDDHHGDHEDGHSRCVHVLSLPTMQARKRRGWVPAR